MSSLRDEVALQASLSNAMLVKMRRNRHKPDWRDEDVIDLLDSLRDEVNELEAAWLGGEDETAVWFEAADVANIAAMVADNLYPRGRE